MSASEGQPAAGTSDVEAKKVNRPSDSRLKQQKLKAWQPILTAGTVLPTFFVIGVIFIPIGAVLLVASNNVSEYIFDYTNCASRDNGSVTCTQQMKDQIKATGSFKSCICDLKINITEDISGDIYIYYGLTNFYQNHRRYVKSRDDKQLLGKLSTNPDDVANDCSPFKQYNSTSEPIAPCGAIANSMFNDTFTMDTTGNEVKPITFNYTGIAWPSDYNSKFGNPSNMSMFDELDKPPSWTKKANQLSTDAAENGFKNESFIVWMRVSALPTFRKLHSRVMNSSIPKGTYLLKVGYNYPVSEFDGKKKFIISTTSWAGGKNSFLGVAYITVGCLCNLTGLIFFFIHLKFGKTLTEMANIGR